MQRTLRSCIARPTVTICMMLAVTVFVLGMGGMVYADTLFTPPMNWGGDAQTPFACSIVNVSGQERTIRIQILDLQAQVSEDSGDFTPTPGFIAQLRTSGGDGMEQFYCKFDVQGGTKHFRASACILEFPIAGNCTVALPAQ